MNINQQTVKDDVVISGVGLHTGVTSTIKITPAKTNFGIKFKRTDLASQTIIPADVDYVVSTDRGTTLQVDDASVHTVEHLLAALVGLQIDNVLIEIDAQEPPIMDGSAMPFIEAIEKVGIKEQSAPRNYFEVPESVIYSDKDNNIEIAALPLEDYRITVMVDYNSPVLGSQHASLNEITDFKNEISSSRTFCFLHELEILFKNNLIKGGDLSNAIVIANNDVKEEQIAHLSELLGKPKIKAQENGILNNVELRWKNEPARHKLLDVVGDLALLGRPIKAQILAARPGHTSNVAFVKKLKKVMVEKSKSNVPKYDPKLPPVLDINDIVKILPHRYPFLLIDKIFHLDEEEVAGIKNVTFNDNFFQGHFPGNPVMPGVLQIEAMAQIGGILVLNTVEDPENYWTYFLGIDDFKFRKMVLPGDTLIMKLKLLQPIRRGIAKMRGTGYVGNNLVCEGTLLASIVRKKDA